MTLDQLVLIGSKGNWDFGRQKTEVLTETKTLNHEVDCGKILFLNAATEFTTTLPAIADAGVGWCCSFIVQAAPASADYVISEDTASDTNKILTNGIVELEVDTGDDGPYNAGHTTVSFADGVAVAGDRVDFLCDGTNWLCSGHTNADGGVTLA